MANNIGLQFDPLGGLGIDTPQRETSVPTTANDYFNKTSQSIPMLSLPKVQPTQMQKASDFVNWVVNRTPEDKERSSDPFYDLNKWTSGLDGLSKEDRNIWEAQNAQKIAGRDDSWKDRLWRNQQFINTFGMDAFQAYKKEDRDEIYQDYLLNNAVNKKYDGDSNLEQILSLTPQGKEELLKSDYKSDYMMKWEDKEDSDKDWTDYSLRERGNAIVKNINEKMLEGAGVGSVVGGIAGGGVGTIPGFAVGGLTGAGYGLLRGIVMPESSADYNKVKKKADNDDILNKITVADNKRKKEEASSEINERLANLMDAYTQGGLTSEQIDEIFDKIALNKKETTEDAWGDKQEIEYKGSNYYSAFKGTDEFEHFGTIDKLRYIAQTQVLAQKYGQGDAMAILDQDMQNYVSGQQTSWDWIGNTGKNIWVGGVANLANNAVALGALGAYTTYAALHEIDNSYPTGEEALANYLKGKDASGNGEDNVLSPQYWNKVDQYNTFDPDAIAKADENGNISKYNNVVTPGTENDFWTWNTFNEGLRMNKFAWSDLLKNLALAKVVGAATKIAGGIEIAPGVLATESNMAAKAINTLGAQGILNASSLGIDAAYGMQTYEEVLRQNNERLDKIIQKDVEAEVLKRLETPEAKQDIKEYIAKENKRREASAGERGRYVPVNEAEVIEAYARHLENQVREEQEALHETDRKQAELDAANAYAIDATVEHIRMATTNGVFKNYLFDKGTLNALKGNNPYVRTTVDRTGKYAIGKHATRNKALSTLGMNVWGGFHSNYFDDVTVGLAEGFAIQDYNNYLLQKYNPAAYGAVLDDYVNPFVAGMAGARDAMVEGRSLMDGGIGALGTFLTASPNVVGIASRVKKAIGRSKTNSNTENKDTKPLVADLINNPIIESVLDAKAATRLTEAEIKRANDILKEHGYSFDNMVETLSALNQAAVAREGTSVLEAEDAKDREAFALASSLLALKNSSVVADAQAEPDKATWSKKKKAASTIGKGLNLMLGVPVFTEAESSYTNAMQSLQDASTIDQSSDAETQARQDQLIQTFLGLDANKNAMVGMSEEEKINFAKERLKKNADGLINVMNRTEELQKKFDKSIQAALSPELRQQLMYQYVLDDRWKARSKELEQQITKPLIIIGREENAESNNGSNLVAKYGSMKGYERTLKAQQKRVEDAQAAYDKIQWDAEEEKDPTMQAIMHFRENSAKAELKKQQAELKSIKAQEPVVKQTMVEQPKIINAQQILKLNADERLRMLDDFYRSDYSQEQQAEIDKAKNLLIEDGTSINEAMEKVRDASILKHRIEDNMEVAKKIMQNPYEANLLQQALIDNRRRAVINYFNDKVVAEAFNDFNRDTESTVSQENVEKKARNYSTAVLNGLLKAVEQNLRRTKRDNDIDDKTLTLMQDGIKTVLTERDNKVKDLVDLDSFIGKTKKVDHSEVRLQDGAPASAIERAQNTGEFETQYSEVVTTDRELSQNDKRLLGYATDFAAEKGISMDEVANRVGTKEFDDYIQERNHAYQLTGNPLTGEATEVNVMTAENQANQVSPEYMRGLIKDVMNAFKDHKEKVAEIKAEKPTADRPESVATAPVEPQEKTREEEVRPDEVDSTDPLGLKKKKTGNTSAEKAQEGGTQEQDNASAAKERNAQILEDGGLLNSSILEDVDILLEELDKMDMPEQTRDRLKDIIDSNITSHSYSNIKSLQNDIMAEALITNTQDASQLNAKATTLAGLNISKIKAAKANKDGITVEGKEDSKSNNNPNTPLPQTPSVLETQDLDILINYPVWENYIKAHNVVGFLQKLSDAWNKETEEYRKTGKQSYLHQSQIVFIYDPALARGVKESMENRGDYYNSEKNAPIIMALEITSKNKNLVEDGSQLITIKDVADNKTKQYQAIGFMPSNEVSESSSESMKATAKNMAALRDRINYEDANAHVLRYAPNNNTGKYNGSVIKTNINKISSHTEDTRIPHATKDTPKLGVQQLMEENSHSATESFVKATDEERQKYQEAQNDPAALRKTNLYQKMREAFIKKLFKRERQTPDEEGSTKEIDFRLQKGTQDSFPKIVLTKRIGETLDKNTGRPIVDLLREVDTEGNNAEEVIDSNSRFKRLYNVLKNLQKPSGLFNAQGQLNNNTTTEAAINALEKDIQNAISNNLNVINLAVRVEFTNSNGEKLLNIHTYSGNTEDAANRLSTLTTRYNGQISPTEYTLFLRDLILDEDGAVRPNPKNSKYDMVKWQVNYEDANTANIEATTKAEHALKDAALTNLRDLYDDGVFEMQTSKLAYPSRSVTATIGRRMKLELYPEETAAKPKAQTPAATETKPVGTVETGAGLVVDGDTGATIETTKEAIINALPQVIRKTIERMIEDGKSRKPEGNHYNIVGMLWSRVTSIKYAMEGMGKRFNPKNAYALPSSLLGNSFDTFGRDVFNNIFDQMSDEERKTAFGNYDNSTEKNYSDAYLALKAFDARLRANGQVIIATGNREEPGNITPKGELSVTVRNGQKVETKKVRVAGTVDVLAIDKDGNLHIYDFKTHRSDFNETVAKERGYDRQLSMYAKFLEDEYGLKVASINIIPIKVDYPTPSGKDNDGNAIVGAQKTYRQASPNSNQLEVKNITADDSQYEEFKGANFQVEKEFSLTRLNDEKLVASFDKMTEDEKAAIVEAIQDQSETPASEVTNTDDVVNAKPEVEDTATEGEEMLDTLDDDFNLFDDDASVQIDTSDEALAKDIAPDDPNGLLNRLEEHKKNCGGKK